MITSMQTEYSNIKSQAPLKSLKDRDFEFSFAFQPIVNAASREIVSFEALVRGPHDEPSHWVFAQVSQSAAPYFDIICRQKAIHLASRLKVPRLLSLNLSARSISEVDASITETFRVSHECGIPVENIIFEVLETESLTDQRNLVKYLRLIQDFGFITAIDDFGSGYSGLKLLVKYQPNYIKLDRHLIGNIQDDPVKQCIFQGVQNMCLRLGINIVAEGVETAAEYHWLEEAGVGLFQGYYFARPAFEALPDVTQRAFSS